MLSCIFASVLSRAWRGLDMPAWSIDHHMWSYKHVVGAWPLRQLAILLVGIDLVRAGASAQAMQTRAGRKLDGLII